MKSTQTLAVTEQMDEALSLEQRLLRQARLSPSFFKGAAGVGYVLLRLARPSLLPCVLALEAC